MALVRNFAVKQRQIFKECERKITAFRIKLSLFWNIVESNCFEVL